jgi:hypothetical protein
MDIGKSPGDAFNDKVFHGLLAPVIDHIESCFNTLSFSSATRPLKAIMGPDAR